MGVNLDIWRRFKAIAVRDPVMGRVVGLIPMLD